MTIRNRLKIRELSRIIDNLIWRLEWATHRIKELEGQLKKYEGGS